MTFRIFLASLFLLAGMNSYAQPDDNTFHEVQAGETKYGISRQYDITIEQLERFNPEIKAGLKEGMSLLIPSPSKLTPDVATSQMEQDSGFVYHNVKPKETLYSLARTYGVTVEQIKLHNPELENGLKIGAQLKIPVGDGEQTEERDEVNYVYHKIRAGENILGLSEKYKIRLDSVYLLNPKAGRGLRIGEILKFPRKGSFTSDPPISAEPVDILPGGGTAENEDTTVTYFLYQIKTGDSFFSLKKEFNVTQAELVRLNPELKRGLSLDKYIIIPKKEKQKKDTGWLDKLFDKVDPDVNVDDKNPLEDNQKDRLDVNRPLKFDMEDTINIRPSRLFKVGVMLPFHTVSYDTLDLNRKGYTRVAIEFYNGFLMAADSMAKAGMNLNLKVVDTRNSLVKVKAEIGAIRRADVDMVVGPLFKENVEFVADELRYAGIPVVSPLSKSVDVNNRPNLIQCIPGTLETDARIAEILNVDFTNAQILFAHSGSSADREEMLQIKARIMARSRGAFLNEIVSNGEGDVFSYGDVRSALEGNTKTVVVVTSESQVLLSDLMNKLRQMRDTSIYIIGPSKMSRLPTMEVDYLNSLKVIMPDVNFIDYNNSETIEFISAYREKYEGEPNRFAFQGYDVGMYFLNKLWKSGRHMPKTLGDISTMLNTGFYFVPTEGGGLQNQFLYSTGIRNFTLVKFNAKSF